MQASSFQGLSSASIPQLQAQYGKNVFKKVTGNRFLRVSLDIIKDPMFLLLSIACALYFILGQIDEGLMMLLTMLIVAAISIFQEARSFRALEALKQFSEPKVNVIRDNALQVINHEELVPGDVILLEEGDRVPADAELLETNDLSVNESIITGESLPAEKHLNAETSLLYQGTTIESGKCVARVLFTGSNTQLGKIGKSISNNSSQKTVLQVHIMHFVRRLALFGFGAFSLIFLVNYLHYHQLVPSLLFALTLAMSVVPEEIPVAFSSFMALGAYKMSRLGIISRQPQVIENLGAVNTICLDKTGTITENRMKVIEVFSHKTGLSANPDIGFDEHSSSVLYYAVLASETNPFDAMEKAIVEASGKVLSDIEEAGLKMVYEYPLDGHPPMMTHLYQRAGSPQSPVIVSSKGAAERILRVCHLQSDVEKQLLERVRELSQKGFRVLGVASATFSGEDYPISQDDFPWKLEGLVALYDPPKQNVREVIKLILDAGITVKLITGDHPGTAIHIAERIGMNDPLRFRLGDEIMGMDEAALRKAVETTNVFARMFPDAKLRVINALKENGSIVAMTGDGVNDAPAIKAANIGISMGRAGSETARQVADLVLTDDNLEKITKAISEGRKIYSNLVKAFRYIISIHIPIILTAALPLILGWIYPNIFTPIHIIFLELIMGPTCSIFFEREPVEEDIMRAPPRGRDAGLFSREELMLSIVQGLVITAGVLGVYYYAMRAGNGIESTRTLVFTTLIMANIFLTFVNRSFTKTVLKTIHFKNSLAPIVLLISTAFLALMLLYPPARGLFQLAPIGLREFFLCLGVSFASVAWFEVYKANLPRP